MLRKLILGLLILLAIVALQRLVHAQDCGTSSQSQVTQEGQVAGFDNPMAADCFGNCYSGYDAIPAVVFGYALGIFVGVVRAVTGESSLRSMPTRMLNIELSGHPRQAGTGWVIERR